MEFIERFPTLQRPSKAANFAHGRITLPCIYCILFQWPNHRFVKTETGDSTKALHELVLVKVLFSWKT